MYIVGIGTACPEQRYTKSDCWKAFLDSPWIARLDRRARMLAERVLLHDNGIEARRLSVASLQDVLANDPGVLISACLFGDGAGAVVLSTQPHRDKRSVRWKTAVSLIGPAERDALRFEQRDGLLRNVLTVAVPELAAKYAQQVLATVLA